MTPTARSDVQQKHMRDEDLLYDPVNRKFHFLNESAAFIFTRCAGSQTSAEIAVALAAEYGLEATRAEHDVNSALETFRDLGLLED